LSPRHGVPVEQGEGVFVCDGGGVGVTPGVGVVAEAIDANITTSQTTSSICRSRRSPNSISCPNRIIIDRIDVPPPRIVQPLPFEFDVGVAGRVGVGGWKGGVIVGVGLSVGSRWQVPSTQLLTPSMHVVPQHGSSDPPHDTHTPATQTLSGA